MVHSKSKQLEEYKHRINNDPFRLYKVNAEVIYFLDTNGYLDVLFKGIVNYKDRLFKALGSSDHSQRIVYAKDLIKDLWEIEIGLGPYPFSEVLAEFEFGRQFYSGYRDHVLHQMRVFLLGSYFFFGCEKVKALFQSGKGSQKNFILKWKITALSHDIGYVFEVENGEINTWVIDKVFPVFDERIGFPLSNISSEINKNYWSTPDEKRKKRIFENIKKRGITRNRELEIQNCRAYA